MDVRFYSNDLDVSLTIREFLRELLLALWEEGEGFSGKRPFGNSGWKYQVYASLVKEKFIEGTLDREGYLQDYDRRAAHELLQKLIVAAMANKVV